LDASGLYLQHLEAINRIAERLCKRNGVFGADAEDFASEVRLRLLEDDYAVIRKHRGDSSMTTFLTVVISNLFRDYRIKMWGKWRPSAEARRLGDAAVLLETAMYRDGRSFEEACNWLEQSGRGPVNRKELRTIAERLPVRTPRRIEGEDQLSEVESPALTNGALLAAERRQQLETLHGAVARTIATLDSEDQLIIRLRFYEGFSIAEVARGLRLPQKPLYPRITRLLQTLSTALTREGIGPEFREFFESP
jgi:RNA polymerase sigma factor for flagellar operon FliA